MKFACTINAWADTKELLKACVDNLYPVVDLIIVVYSNESNYGTVVPWNVDDYLNDKCVKLLYKNRGKKMAYLAECQKRNEGLDYARNLGFTHFLNLDADEFYEQRDIQKAKEYLALGGWAGSVVGCKTYFKAPTLTIGMDHTLVPFIHEITPTLKYEADFKGYPFTRDAAGTHIDPTRRLNITGGVVMFDDVVMHHFSYVRSDLRLKVNNSSARGNLLKSTVFDDYRNAKPGYYCQMYRSHLTECEDIFGIGEIIDSHI